MVSLLARARAYDMLTPGERAFLKLVEGLFCAALVAALPIVAGALGAGNIQWGEIGREALAAGGVAALLALGKYARAHGDPTLANALDSAGQDAAAQPGVNHAQGSANPAQP